MTFKVLAAVVMIGLSGWALADGTAPDGQVVVPTIPISEFRTHFVGLGLPDNVPVEFQEAEAALVETGGDHATQLQYIQAIQQASARGCSGLLVVTLRYNPDATCRAAAATALGEITEARFGVREGRDDPDVYPANVALSFLRVNYRDDVEGSAAVRAAAIAAGNRIRARAGLEESPTP